MPKEPLISPETQLLFVQGCPPEYQGLHNFQFALPTPDLYEIFTGEAPISEEEEEED